MQFSWTEGFCKPQSAHLSSLSAKKMLFTTTNLRRSHHEPRVSNCLSGSNNTLTTTAKSNSENARLIARRQRLRRRHTCSVLPPTFERHVIKNDCSTKINDNNPWICRSDSLTDSRISSDNAVRQLMNPDPDRVMLTNTFFVLDCRRSSDNNSGILHFAPNRRYSGTNKFQVPSETPNHQCKSFFSAP